ncbi:MAG: proteasome assembly chaperone family protein [Methanobacteriota archaeon]
MFVTDRNGGWSVIETEEPADLGTSLLVVGMPSVGMVGPIAGSFVAKHLGMRVVGTVMSDALQPVGVVRQGLVGSPVQIWAANGRCGPDRAWDRTLLLLCDIPLPPETLVPLADVVAAWAAERGVGLIVGLEGYAPEAPKPAAAGARAILHLVLGAAGAHGVAILSQFLARPMEEAAFAGFHAALLLRADQRRIPAVCLFAPVLEPSDEPVAAVTLLKVIDGIIPTLRIAPEDLTQRAEFMSLALSTERRRRGLSTQRMHEQAEVRYS